MLCLKRGSAWADHHTGAVGESGVGRLASLAWEFSQGEYTKIGVWPGVPRPLSSRHGPGPKAQGQMNWEWGKGVGHAWDTWE